jgi:proteic killer suppression protein
MTWCWGNKPSRISEGGGSGWGSRNATPNAAPSLDTLRALPSNRLEALRGNRNGQFSIRINQQWRICFEWPDGQTGPSNVQIVD